MLGFTYFLKGDLYGKRNISSSLGNYQSGRDVWSSGLGSLVGTWPYQGLSSPQLYQDYRAYINEIRNRQLSTTIGNQGQEYCVVIGESVRTADECIEKFERRFKAIEERVQKELK